MEIENTSLTIVGEPEEEVRVLYRERGDEPPPPIWEGKLDAEGRVTIDVPQGYLLVFGNHSHRGAILRLHEEKPSELTVELGAEVDENPAAGESE